MKSIKNSKELKHYMEQLMIKALEETSVKIKGIIDEFIQDWYDDYTPKIYQRTNQFLNSCTTSQVVQSGNSFKVIIFIDYNSMNHNLSDGITEFNIIENAEKGIHGVKYGRSGDTGIGFWEDSIDTIENEHTIIKAFADFLISKGFTVNMK